MSGGGQLRTRELAAAQARLGRQLAMLTQLRGRCTGSTDYARWVDQTAVVLAEIFGPEGEAVRQFHKAVGGRGTDDAFGLPWWGPWGIFARLERGESVLREALAHLAGTG